MIRAFTSAALSLLCLALTVPAVAQSGQTDEPSPAPPPYKQLRYEEDYSYLRSPSKRTDCWDRIKYIPLGRRAGWYLSVGGEVRPYYEFYRHEEWGSEPQDDSGFLLQRYMLHADLHLGERARLFGQIKSGIELGRRGGPRPPDEDKLDVHQAFADFNLALNKPLALTLRAGRQELSFGSARLVTFREGPNVRQSFDGLRLTIKSGKRTVDGIVVKPVETNRGFFDDGQNHQQTFWGVYSVWPSALLLKQSNIDLYYLGLDRKRARFNQGAGREERHTIGARLWNQGDALDYNFELVWQFGKFKTSSGDGEIRAWTVASDTGYTFRQEKVRPRLGVKANVTSGDKDPGDPDLETFNPLFPRGAYFGQLTSVGPLNHVDLHPNLHLSLARSISLTVDWIFYWRQSTTDGVYGIPGNVLRPGNQSRARHVGHQPGMEVSWEMDRHTIFTINYARFYAGKFLKETPPARNITYFAAWVTYRF